MSKKKKDRSGYFADYYEEKKDSLSQQKKERYKNDPELRAKAQKNAKEYRDKKRKEREKLREEGKLPPVNLKRGPRKPVSVMIGGEMHEAYSATVVACRIGRSINTMNYWTKMLLLPETPLRRGGERLYTSFMVQVLKQAILRRGRIQLGDEGFYKEIREGWARTGVFSAHVEILKR